MKLFKDQDLVTRWVEKRKKHGKDAYATILESHYDTDIDDLWDALTNKERLPRWFAPVEGEFKLNGEFQIQGNAHGKVISCDEGRGFELTWEYGEDVSWVKIELSKEGGKTCLKLEHLAYSEGEHFDTYGPGATGVGWDLFLIGLRQYVNTNKDVDGMAYMISAEGRNAIVSSARYWGQATITAGFDPDKSLTAANNTEKFYLGEQ